jgi:pimeloyl-ACP methyl ester carboxylesterase
MIMDNLPEMSDWFGYAKTDFEFEGRSSFLVKPQTVNPDRPWIWRTEFFGHEPQLDIALLKNGWHVAYVQISDMYGAPSSIEVMRGFQEHLETEFALASKVVLEGMSRGGLYAFNYAATFPEKVAALYLDNPVLDIRSWPGGLGSGPGSIECWAQCLDVYGLSAESAAAFKGNPLDQVEQVAKAGVPIIMVCGDADEIVPFEENAAVLARYYDELGAPLELLIKPGFGHHPHSLPNPEPLTEFLRRHLPTAFNIK